MEFEQIREMPVIRGPLAFMIEALPHGFLVTKPGGPMEMRTQLCAASSLDEALEFIRRAMTSPVPA